MTTTQALLPLRGVTLALDGVRGAVKVTRNLPEIERLLADRFETVLDHFRQTIRAVESLVPLLERQGETTESLVAPLEANQAATARMVEELATVRTGIETMHPDITAMRKAMESLNENLAEIRVVAEPLRSASRRVGRFSDRHPSRSRN